MKQTLYDIILKAPRRDEASMSAGFLSLSHFVEDMKKYNAELSEKVKFEFYEIILGRHFNEDLAKEFVSDMAGGGDTCELVDEMLVKWAHQDEETFWDAYVAYNYFAHKMPSLQSDRNLLAKLAEEFWFSDQDFSRRNDKVWHFFIER